MTFQPLPDLSELAEPKVNRNDDKTVHVVCQVPDCYYFCTYGKGFEDDIDKALETFLRNHLSQHLPGKTPDVWLHAIYSGHCSNCRKSFSWEDDGEERVWCDSCGASWDLFGSDGRTDIEIPE